MRKFLPLIAAIAMALSPLSLRASVDAVEPTEGNGSTAAPYIIANAGNLVWFANQVNGGNTAICAELSADIDMSDDQTMIGQYSNRYSGTFNGAGHKVTVAYNTANQYCALFRYTESATIRNLRTSGTITTSSYDAAGIIAWAAGDNILENVGSDITISSTYSGDAHHGGLIAYVHDCTDSIANCYFTGKIIGSTSTKACAGLVGNIWSGYVKLVNCFVYPSEIGVSTTDGYTLCEVPDESKGSVTITNCYYVNAMGTAQGTQTTSAAIASGELCYKLNGSTSTGTLAWHQNINNGSAVDAAPVLDATHGIIYYGTSACPQSLTYSNATHTWANTYDDGELYCSVSNCKKFLQHQQPETDAQGNYLIGNKGNLCWFANYVNNGNTTINGKLTTDVSLGNNNNMIGDSNSSYAGTFDGDGHTVTINYTASADVTALFRYTNGATIKNIITKGAIASEYRNAAGLAGICYNTTFEQAGSTVAVTSYYDGTPTNAGLVVAIYEGGSLNNCFFTGKLIGGKATDWSELVGWYRLGTLTISNCYVNPSEMIIGTGNGATIVRHAESVTPTITNCYYVTAIDKVQGEQITTDQIKLGELCNKLNGTSTTTAWTQNIATDSVPTLGTQGLHYSRTMANQWGTICLPFAIAQTNGYDIYSLTGATSESISLTKTTSLAAGTPALIRCATGATAIDAEACGTGFASTPVSCSAISGLTITGCYAQTELTDIDGYVIANNTFWYIADIKGEDKVYCAPFHAYLAGYASGNVKQLNIIADGKDVSAIEAVNAITTGKAEYFDINGRRISDLQPGVNIIRYSNGATKKIILK